MTKQRRYGLIDLETGEKFEGVITPWFPKVGGKWVRVFQDSGKALLERTPQLRGESVRILLYLTFVAGWNNSVPTTAVIASKLDSKQANVSRAYSELITAGFLLKRDGAYYLNPLYCWKGSPQQLDQACRDLLPGTLEPTRKALIL